MNNTQICINCKHAKKHETLDVYWCDAGVSMFIAFGDRVVGGDFGCTLFKPKI